MTARRMSPSTLIWVHSCIVVLLAAIIALFPDLGLFLLIGLPILITGAHYGRRVYLPLLVALVLIALILAYALSTDFGFALKSIVGGGVIAAVTAEVFRALRRERLRDEERFRQFFGNLPDYCYMLSSTGDILDVNRAALKALGYRKEELAGKPLETLYAPECRSRARSLFDQSEKTGREEGEELWIIARSGERRAVLLQATAVRDPQGRVLHSVSVQRDITEQKRAEEARHESETRFGGLFDNMTSGVAVYEPVRDGEDFIIKDMNKAGERISRAHRDEILGKSVLEAFPGVRELGLFEVFQRVHRTGEPEEHPLSRYEDARLSFWVENHVYRLATGEIVAAYDDITERKRTEAALRESESRFRALFDNAPVGYHELDPEGRIRRVNRTELAMLGYEENEMVGRYAWEFVVEEDVARRAVHEKVSHAGEPGPGFERTMRCKDGTTVPVLIRDRLLKASGGRVTGIRSTLQDISARKRIEEERQHLEAQVQHAQKLESLGVLAGGIAHDFNNLLMGILGNADLALDEISGASPARGYLTDIETAGKRAAELCKQMLAYSGRGAFVIEAISLSEVVREMAHLLETAISKKAAVKYNFAQDIPPVLADATQLRQVVMNLITNASEAIGEDSGVVSVTTGAMECDQGYLNGTYLSEGLPAGRFVYLEVADTGCGMDGDTKDKIFDPFFSTKFTGRGLGLAAVLGIVRGHGGTVKVYSELGRGTTFKVLLPASDQPAQAAEDEARQTEEWAAAGTILVVDDEETVRAPAQRMLERAGFTVLVAADGHEGVEMFRQHADEIAAVLLDMTMPRLNGEEVFRELRRHTPDVRVILSSGYNEQDAVERFTGKGLAGFVQKPYQSKDLIAKLRDVLER